MMCSRLTGKMSTVGYFYNERRIIVKNFNNYNTEKYDTDNYTLVEDGIYMSKADKEYVTSLTFEMEDTDGDEDEVPSPQNITQFPFEGILNKFSVWVSDFYEELNENSEVTCYQEFASDEIENLRELRSMIGKRVYGQIHDPSDDESDWSLIIE